MKMRILGVLLLIAGFCSLAVGISFMSGAESSSASVAEQGAEESLELVSGTYYINGNTEKSCIELYDDGSVSFDGGERLPYEIKVWKDMTVTDGTGKISVIDQYFLGTASGDCEYISTDKMIVYNDRYYSLVK